MSIVLIDSSSTSLTVSWPGENGDCYILEYKKEDEDEYQTLSNQLKSSQVRKRNLNGTNGYFFRVRSCTTNDWMSHEEPFLLLTQEQEQDRLMTPTIVESGSNTAIISWKAPTTQQTTTTYELQMRSNKGGEAWNTIASSLSNTTVKKKNLESTCQYQFRVRISSTTTATAFSTPSELFQPSSLHPSFFNLFSNGTLLWHQQNKIMTLKEALSHVDFILVYVSAHWCPPCRQYTPQLATMYNTQNTKFGGKKSFQIVFVSADHDESSFDDYYQTMPWLAVPYDEDARESIMAYLRVQGIPRLVVFDRRTGAIVDDNAVGKPVESWIYK